MTLDTVIPAVLHRGRVRMASHAGTYLLAMFAGGFQAWAIASPRDGEPSWWLQLLSLAALALLVERSRSAFNAGLLTWLFAFVWIAGSVWWLFISMHVYGGVHWFPAVMGVFLLALFLASYYALAAAVYHRLRPPQPALRAFLFAALWLAAELLRASLFTGFPWAAIGYAHVDGPLSGLASSVGVYGIGAVAALVAYMPVLARSTGLWRRQAWPATALCLVALAVGVFVTMLVARADEDPPRRRWTAAVLVAGGIATILAVGVLSAPIRPLLPWWSIVVANVLAAIAAGAWLAHRRPGVWRRMAFAGA